MRNYKNWIIEYLRQYDNGFVPKRFYLWGAISTIAAALERKVWLPWHAGNIYPALYVFLVSDPGMGKTSAMRPGQKLLWYIDKKLHKPIRWIPSQITDAKLLDELKTPDYFTYKEKQYPHTSAYLVATEAAASFKFTDENGIIKSLTRLYDPEDFTKATVSRDEIIKIVNPNLNLFAGTTFHDLQKFLDREGILSGFASRCTFVAHHEHKKRTVEWYDEEEQSKERTRKRSVVDPKLAEDLVRIHSLVGGFKGDDEVKATWKEWWDEHDQKMRDTKNPILKAMMTRKQVTMLKLIQCLCASSSDDMIIKYEHWHWANKLVTDVENDIPKMLRTGQSNPGNKISGVKSAVLTALSEDPPYTHTPLSLMSKLTLTNFDPIKIEKVIKSLSDDPKIMDKRADGRLKLIADPNEYI